MSAWLLCALLGAQVGEETPAGAQGAVVHRVAAGEYLVKILRRAHLRPIYGAEGALARTLRGNRWIRHPDHIEVGQIIVLPSEGGARPAPREMPSPLAAPPSPAHAPVAARLPPAAGGPPPSSAGAADSRPAGATGPLGPPLSAAGVADPRPRGATGPRGAPSSSLDAAHPRPAEAAGPVGPGSAAPPALLRLLAGPTWTFDHLVASDRAHGGEARLLSLVGPGVRVEAEGAVAQRLRVVAALAGRLAVFDAPRGALALERREHALGRATLGVAAVPAAPWRLGLTAGLAREVFAQAASSAAAALVPALLPEAALGVERALWASGPLRLGAGAHGRLAGGPRWVHVGGEVGAAARLDWRPSERLWLVFEAGYAYRRQDTTLTRQSVHRLDVGVALAGQHP